VITPRFEVENVSAPRHHWESPNPNLPRLVIHVDTLTAIQRFTATPGARN